MLCCLFVCCNNVCVLSLDCVFILVVCYCEVVCFVYCLLIWMVCNSVAYVVLHNLCLRFFRLLFYYLVTCCLFVCFCLWLVLVYRCIGLMLGFGLFALCLWFYVVMIAILFCGFIIVLMFLFGCVVLFGLCVVLLFRLLTCCDGLIWMWVRCFVSVIVFWVFSGIFSVWAFMYFWCFFGFVGIAFGLVYYNSVPRSGLFKC